MDPSYTLPDPLRLCASIMTHDLMKSLRVPRGGSAAELATTYSRVPARRPGT